MTTEEQKKRMGEEEAAAAAADDGGGEDRMSGPGIFGDRPSWMQGPWRRTCWK
jgi:hypothetical protein